MEPERWRRVEELFHRAADLDAGARTEFLDFECGSDRELRVEIERLLACDSAAGDAFSRVDARPQRALEDPLLGRNLGVYRLTARIASGGMGVIYRAERSDGLFQQEVAIKLIRAERATEWMLRRFEFERRTLAALQHPCIARLYDGGTTDDGCPYFVMELVHGESIDRYCERQHLSIVERVRLFVQVCRAVQFAHQSLVVHCDLKPANILIDERRQPRLLDFGIARLLEDAPDDAGPAATGTIARVLTPEYASPEQLAGGAVTTSIDVYSLGVVLYELLTGRRPFESASRSPADWERLIREQAPERPSTAAGHASNEPGTTAPLASSRAASAALRRALRGDLDRVVLMALRKEPDRRYASVQEFADDLERHLAGQPVRARHNSVAYLATKFVRRNRVVVAASVAVLAALLVGLFAARRSARIAEAEAEHARMESDSFQSLADFLMDAFLPVQPSQDRAWQEQARERILAHAERVRRQYAGSDHGRANMLEALGQVCQRLELFDDAETLMRETLAIREQAFGADSLEYARSLRSLGQLAYEVGDYARAAEWLEHALRLHRAESTSRQSDVSALANDLAACVRALGSDAEAEALHREALELRRKDGAESLPVAESLNNLAAIHVGRAQYELAVAELRQSLQIRASILGDEHLLTLQTMSNLATVLWRYDQRDEALDLMQRAENGYRALGGDGQSELGLTLSNLASMELEVGDMDGAATNLGEALELQRARLGDDHPQVAATLAKLAVLHHARNRDEEARRLWEDVLRIRRSARTSPRELADALYGYGVFLADTDDVDEALRLVQEAIDVHHSQGFDDPAALGRAEYVLGSCLARSGKRDAAREHLEEAARLYDSRPDVTAEERERVQRMLERLDRADGR